MKNRKLYLIVFILFLYFSLVLHITQPLFNEQDDKDYRNILTPLSASNSVVQEWNRTWGTSATDIAVQVALDSSDNIYLAGFTDSYGEGSTDIVLVKFNSFGGYQWNRTWGGIFMDMGWGVAVDLSESIYVSGSTKYDVFPGYSDMVLIKYDSSGVQQWNRTWGGIMDDLGYGVVVDSSDNIYLAGQTDSFGAGDYDMVMVKYDSSGELHWNTTWGGNEADKGIGIAVDSSDNIYLAGFTHSFGEGATDMALVKFGKAEGKEEPIIHGFSILFFISAIGVITALNLKKKLK